jgi:hypothetical protein
MRVERGNSEKEKRQPAKMKQINGLIKLILILIFSSFCILQSPRPRTKSCSFSHYKINYPDLFSMRKQKNVDHIVITYYCLRS